jgi:AraC-like DNA-binding protein
VDRTSSSAWVRGLVEMFASQGVDVPRLFAAAQLPVARMHDPNGRFTPDEVTRLWEFALASTGNPVLGIDAELAARFIDFEAVGYATLSSENLEAALREFARYLALISSATTFAIEPQGDDLWLVMGHTGYTRPVPPQRSAYSLLALLTLARWVTRREIRPLAAQFGFEAPGGNRAAFERAFGCPAKFMQPDNRLLFARSDLALKLPSHNPQLLALHEQVLEERLAFLGSDSLGLRVSEELMRRLARGEPRREEVAAALSLADRTLQRRLQAENTSFQKLLDDTRRELARKLLADPRCAIGEAAHRLGFADPSNFFRACRRWFGCAPGQYRDKVAQQPTAGTQGQ